MDRERIILLRILSIVLLVPFLLFINSNLSSIKSDRELLSRYENNSSDITRLQSEIFSLNEEEKSLENQYKELSSNLFSENDIKFYEFCDFIVNSATNRGVVIENYSTNESSSPKRINLSAEGSIRSILDFLQYLYTFDKKVDIDQMSVSYNSNDNNYRLSMLINFSTIKTVDEDKK